MHLQFLLPIQNFQDCNGFDHLQIFQIIYIIPYVMWKDDEKFMKMEVVLTNWNYIHLSGLLSKNLSVGISSNDAIEYTRNSIRFEKQWIELLCGVRLFSVNE